MRVEKNRLRLEASALKVQSQWRIRCARNRVKKLRSEKEELLLSGAALKLQCAWRRRKARGMLSYKRRIFGLKLTMARSKIGAFMLPLLARSRIRKLIQEQKLTFIVKIISASGLASADSNGSSDPYVLLHGESSTKRSAASSTSRNQNYELSSTRSLYKSRVVNENLNPVWNETGIVTNIDGFGSIVLTVADHDIIGSPDFLGQVL